MMNKSIKHTSDKQVKKANDQHIRSDIHHNTNLNQK